MSWGYLFLSEIGRALHLLCWLGVTFVFSSNIHLIELNQFDSFWNRSTSFVVNVAFNHVRNWMKWWTYFHLLHDIYSSLLSHLVVADYVLLNNNFV